MKIFISVLSVLISFNFVLANNSPEEVTGTAQDIANMLENGAADADPNVLDEIGKSLRFIKFQLQEEGLEVVHPTEPEPKKYNLFCGTSAKLIDANTQKVLADFSYDNECAKAILQAHSGYFCGPSNTLTQIDSLQVIADYSFENECEKAIRNSSSGYICGPSAKLIDLATQKVLADYSFENECQKAIKQLSK